MNSQATSPVAAPRGTNNLQASLRVTKTTKILLVGHKENAPICDIFFKDNRDGMMVRFLTSEVALLA